MTIYCMHTCTFALINTSIETTTNICINNVIIRALGNTCWYNFYMGMY